MNLLQVPTSNEHAMPSSDWPTVSFTFPPPSPTDVSSSSAVSTAEATAGNDGSSFLSRNVDESLEVHCKHWIRVGNLSVGTTDGELKKLFYPYGGDEAFVVREQDSVLAGFVGFELSDMASIAAEKMNAFIPCRQSHTLAVRRVAVEEVALARCCAASEPVRRPLSHLMQGSLSEQAVMSALLSRLHDPSLCAAEVVLEIGRATPSGLRCLLASLLAVSIQAADGNASKFFDALLKELLRCLLDTQEFSAAPGTAAEVFSPSAHAVVNSGAALGNLFALRILPGDPFIFASRLLQRTGAANVAQVNGICAIAHACHALPFPISKASFWALVGHTATEAKSPQLRDTLLAHLRQLKTIPQVPALGSFSTQPPLPPFTGVTAAANATSPLSPLSAASSARAAQVSDGRLRTIHISHLPPQLSQREFMELLLRGGLVNKVRLCIGSGYTTVFAFVEMQSADGARAVTRMLNNLNMMGLCIRVQAARSPIQDLVSEDAAYSRAGATLKPCTFGTSTAPLMACAASV